MDKPFKTIDEQLEILKEHGVAVNEKTSIILMKEGYYSVINGYKTPFIDAEATKRAGEDRYKEATAFSDIYALFLFDRELRGLTFHYLVRAEALIRTTCAYTFSEAHQEQNAYLSQANFASEDEYLRFGLKGYWYNIQKLQGDLSAKIHKSERDFVEHYRREHDNIPLWVLANDMTFGNIEHFFNLMKPDEQRLVCTRIVEANNRIGSEQGFFTPKEARIGLDVLAKFRNICAHDERLYCAKVGYRKQADYISMLVYLKRYIDDSDLNNLLKNIAILIK